MQVYFYKSDVDIKNALLVVRYIQFFTVVFGSVLYYLFFSPQKSFSTY